MCVWLHTKLVLGEADGLGVHDLVRLLVLQDTVLHATATEQGRVINTEFRTLSATT